MAFHATRDGLSGEPFLCPEFAVSRRYLPLWRPRRRARRRAGTTIGFFPYERRKFGIGVPIGAGLNDCQGLIHATGAEWDSRELLRACKIAIWQFDNLVEGQLPFDRYKVAVAPSPVIDLTDGFAAYQEKLRVKSPQFSKDLARKARKLERETGELSFTVDSRDVAELRALMVWKSGNITGTDGLTSLIDRGSWTSSSICSAPMVTASAVCFRFYAREEPRSPHISVYGRGTCSRTGSQRTTPALAGNPLG